MSGQIKLSELLEYAAGALKSESMRCEEWGEEQVRVQAERESKCLAAIAPALVEFIALTVDAARYREWVLLLRVGKGELSKKYDLANDARDRLFEAMKEAGVTCE